VTDTVVDPVSRRRRMVLRDIFTQLDIDRDGQVHVTDIGALGKDGQMAHNHLTVGAERTCSENNFVVTFDKHLPGDEGEFDAAAARMLELAKIIRAERDIVRTDQRTRMLRSIFRAFDIDDSGNLEDAEIMSLTKAESHSTGAEWSIDRSKRVMSEIDRDTNGKVNEVEFLQYFEPAMSYHNDTFRASIDQFIESAELILNEKESRRSSRYSHLDSYERAVREAEDATRRARLNAAKAALMETRAENSYKFSCKAHSVSITDEVIAQHQEDKSHKDTTLARSDVTEKVQIKDKADKVHHDAHAAFQQAHAVEVQCNEEVVSAEQELSSAKTIESKAMRAVREAHETVITKQTYRDGRAKVVADLEEQLRLARIALSAADEGCVVANQSLREKESTRDSATAVVTRADSILGNKRDSYISAKTTADERHQVEDETGRQARAAKPPVDGANKVLHRKIEIEHEMEAAYKKAQELRQKKAEEEAESQAAVEAAKLKVWRAACWIRVREAEEAAARAWQRAGLSRHDASQEHVKAADFEEKSRRLVLLAEFEGTRNDNDDEHQNARLKASKISSQADQARDNERRLDQEAHHYADIARGFQRQAEIEREKVLGSEKDEVSRRAASAEALKDAARRAAEEARQREEAQRIAREKERERQLKEQARLAEIERINKEAELKKKEAELKIERENMMRAAKKAAMEAARLQAIRAKRVQQLQTVFKKWDDDRDRKIDVLEFYELCKCMYPAKWDMSAATRAFMSMDTNKSGDVDETEFILFMLNYSKKLTEPQYQKLIQKLINTCTLKEQAAKDKAKADKAAADKAEREAMAAADKAGREALALKKKAEEEKLRAEEEKRQAEEAQKKAAEDVRKAEKKAAEDARKAEKKAAEDARKKAEADAKAAALAEAKKKSLHGLDPAEAARREEHICALYENFDVNHDQSIGFEEFKDLAKVFEGSAFTYEIAHKVYNKMDKDNDGVVSADEFMNFVMRKTAKLGPGAFDHILEQMLEVAHPHHDEEHPENPAQQNDEDNSDEDHAGTKLEDAMVANIKALLKVTPYTFSLMSSTLTGSRYDDFVNWFMTKSKKQDGYKANNRVNDSDLLTAVTGYLGLNRGKEIREAEEAILAKKGSAKPQKAQVNDSLFSGGLSKKTADREEEIIKAMDVGSDWRGTLNRSEFNELGVALEGDGFFKIQCFEQIDKNNADVIQAADFVAFCQGLRKSFGWERRSKNFLAFSDDEFTTAIDRVHAAAMKIAQASSAPLPEPESKHVDEIMDSAYDLSQEQAMSAREFFDSIDTDGSGQLSTAELDTLAEWVQNNLGEHAKPDNNMKKEGAKILRKLDKDNDGTISFEEFKKYYNQRVKFFEKTHTDHKVHYQGIQKRHTAAPPKSKEDERLEKMAAEADQRKKDLGDAQDDKQRQVRFGSAKAQIEQKSKSSERLSPKAEKAAMKAAAGRDTGLGADRFEGTGVTTKEGQSAEAKNLDKKLADEISETSKKLEEKTRAKEKLATMSEEEIVAQAMGMTVKEYKQMMGIN